MKITLMRHAPIDEKYRGSYVGHLDVALSDEGRAMAASLGKKLDPTQWDALFCSDLLRAKETLHELKLPHKAEFFSELREKSWGEHEGKTFDELCEMGLEYKDFPSWIAQLGGESYEDFKANLHTFLDNVILPSKHKHILIITHAGVIHTLRSILEGISIQESYNTPIPYCSLNTFEL